jgi:hypothetical protein
MKSLCAFRVALTATLALLGFLARPGLESRAATGSSVALGLPPMLVSDTGPVRVAGGAEDSMSCYAWSLAREMMVAPNQENPNRDACGNPGVWHFLGSTGFDHTPSSYYPLPYFHTDVDAIDGMEGWMGAATFDGHHVSTPMVVINTTGETQHPVAGVTFLPDTVHVHPAPSQMIVIGWRSPVNDWVTIRGSVTSADSKPGDGVRWFIDQGATTIALGAISTGGSQSFRNSVGGDGLGRVLVQQGDFIYFLVHPNGTYFCDSTRLTISITRSETRLFFPILAH